MSTGCKVCDDKAARLTIDAYLEQGLTYTTIARSLTLRGFDVSDVTISNHNKHRSPSVDPRIKAPKRDAAIIVKNKVLDALEAMEEGDILDKDLQPALNTALKAQAIEDKREAVKAKTTSADMARAILAALTGAGVPTPQLEDGKTIEGEFEEVDASS